MSGYYSTHGAGGSGGGGSVNSVTAGDGLVNNGTAANPVIDVVAADGTITVTANDIAVGTIDTANITDEAVTLAKLQHIAQNIFLARTSAGTGDVEAITAAQATAILDLFTSVAQGLVPASGGGTDNYLRADGTWTEPPGRDPKNSIEVDANEYQLVGDAASPGNSQYYGTDGAGTKGYHTLPSTGGGGGPNYAFTFTQISDGTTNPSTGEFRVRVGSSGTPSGITQFRFHPTDADGIDQTSLMRTFGNGDFVKIWKDSDPTEWYIYQITSSSGVTASWNMNVTHVGDTGGTFDQSGDWNFLFYNGTNVQQLCFHGTYEVSFANNTNWHTYNATGGANNSLLDRDLGSTTVGTGIDATWNAFVMPANGTIIGCYVSGFHTSGTAGTYQIRAIHAATPGTGVVGTTNTDMTGIPFLTISPTTANGFYTIGESVLTPQAAAAGDYVGLIINRTSSAAQTGLRLQVTIRYLLGV